MEKPPRRSPSPPPFVPGDKQRRGARGQIDTQRSPAPALRRVMAFRRWRWTATSWSAGQGRRKLGVLPPSVVHRPNTERIRTSTARPQTRSSPSAFRLKSTQRGESLPKWSPRIFKLIITISGNRFSAHPLHIRARRPKLGTFRNPFGRFGHGLGRVVRSHPSTFVRKGRGMKGKKKKEKKRKERKGRKRHFLCKWK